jgi:hypothetical protein
MLKSLSLASDNVAAAVDLSNKAWVENTALTKEAELRYSTTESRLKLLNNSLDRLKVTIGNQLNPVLSKLINAGTDVLDWMNDFLESNDAAVPIIAAVTVALGVMVAGITAMTLAATVGTKALVAFKAALDTATGGITFIITIIGAAVAALATLALSFDDGITKANELSEAALGLSDSLEEINRTLEDNLKTNEAAAIVASGYVERLKELEAQGLKTNAQQEEYRRLVHLINEAMPELNAQIDEQTGLIKGGTDALLDNIEALKQKYILEAYQEKYHTLLKKEAEIKVDLYDAERRLTAEKENASELDKKLNGLLDEKSKLYGKIKKESEELSKKTGVLEDVTGSYADEIADLDEQIREVNEQIGTSTKQQTEYEKAITNNQNALDALGNELAFAEEGYRGLLDAQNAATEQAPVYTEAQQVISDAIDAQAQAIEDLRVAHEEAYQAAYNSIDSQIGLFEDMSIKGKANINDLISSLDSQISYMDNYAANIKKAMELGVDKGLVLKLSDGSKESAKILAGIVADGGKNVDELNEKFGKVEEGKQEFAGIVADMKTDFGTQMDAINQRLNRLVSEMNKAAEAGKAAKETGDSYAAGLRSRWQAVYNAAKALAQAANKGWNDYYQKHSPAKVAIKAAAETADSYAMGFEQRMKHMQETTKKFALAANEGYAQTMKEIERYARPQNVILLPTAANNAQTAQQSSTKNINVNIQARTVNADSLREIRLEMIAAQQRERLMEV